MNTIIVLAALVGYAASAVVPQVYVKSSIPEVVGGQLGAPVQSSLYHFSNVDSVVSPLLNHHQVVAPKFQSASLVGAANPVVSSLLNHHQVVAPRFQSPLVGTADSVVSPLLSHHQVVTPRFHSAPFVGTARQYVGAAGPYVGAAGPYVSAAAPYVGAAAPYVGAATPYVGAAGPLVGSAGSLFAAHQAPVVAAPAGSYKTENYQTAVGAKSEIRDESGQYSLSYVSPEGIQVSERSFLKLGAHGDYIPVKEGLYKYISPEGIPVSYGYKADENGFNVQQSPSSVAPVV